MATITIGSNTYTVYQTVAEIDAYADGSIGDAADAWREADEDAKARAGVSSSRLIDRTSWQGEPTAPPQAFPRSGLVDANGTALPGDVVPQQVLDANSELAMAMVAGSAVQDGAANAQGARRLKAGSAEIEYFRQLPGEATRFPLPVMELVGQWLGGDGLADAFGSEATGTCGRTAFGVDNDYDVTRGF